MFIVLSSRIFPFFFSLSSKMSKYSVIVRITEKYASTVLFTVDVDFWKGNTSQTIFKVFENMLQANKNESMRSASQKLLKFLCIYCYHRIPKTTHFFLSPFIAKAFRKHAKRVYLNERNCILELYLVYTQSLRVIVSLFRSIHSFIFFTHSKVRIVKKFLLAVIHCSALFVEHFIL